MKKEGYSLLKAIQLSSFLLIMFYFLMSFITLSLNPLGWGLVGRIVAAFFLLYLFYFNLELIVDSDDEEKK